MAVEDLLRSRPKIHNIILEPPTKVREPFFDPVKEIPQAGWKIINNPLMAFSNFDTNLLPSGNEMSLLFSLYILRQMRNLSFPRENERGRLDPKVRGISGRQFSGVGNPEGLFGYKLFLPREYRLDNSEKANIKERLNRLFYEAIKDKEDRLDYGADWEYFMRNRIRADFLDPTLTEDTTMTDADWQALRKEFDEMGRHGEYVERTLQLASFVKILNPEKVSSLDITKRDERFWKDSIKRDADKITDPEIEDSDYMNAAACLVMNAAALTILASREVEMTEDGIHVIMRKPEEQSSPTELPITRKYDKG